MQKLYKPVRIGIIFAIMAVFFTMFVSALYRMQMNDVFTPESAVPQMRATTRTVTLPAARGNIYDRNGVLLASCRPSYNISINRNMLLNIPNRNEMLQELIYAAIDEGIAYNDTFPVTSGAPFSYLLDMDKEQRRRLDIYFDFFHHDPEMTASDLISWMYTHYQIDYTVGIADARLICGVRYELEIRAIINNLAPYIFASDVGSGFIALIEERGLTGVQTEVGYIREYHTTYAAHLLGYIRRMDDVQLEKYTKLGYPMDALVGQEGAELAFEEYLHGVDGKQEVTTNETGAVMNITVLREPEPGDHIFLTMDLGLQTLVEHELIAHIDKLNQEREALAANSSSGQSQNITGGAVTVLNVWTGELLASATYPTYNPMTLSQNYTMLASDPTNPLFNRATQGWYLPGSTFKMVTALAGLRRGVIDRYTTIYDAGKFIKYADVEEDAYTPSCWHYAQVKVGHGDVNVVQALECSCNYFFIQVSDWLGTSVDAGNLLASTARDFGLGRSTGLEIPESPGRLATPEWNRVALGKGWYAGDTLMTSFGQGNNMFTPVQLANYAATIANGGTLHKLSILRRVKSADFTQLLHQLEPVVLNVITETEYINIIKEGMNAVTRGSNGTAKGIFRDYVPRVAAKTGTVQIEGNEINDGVFVCYAPADEPEIAISIVVEKGGSGSQVMEIAKKIFDYYFQTEIIVRAVPQGELIP